MNSKIRVNTHQYKTLLVRKFKNVFPDYELEIEDNEKGGISYRLKDNVGNYRSNTIHLYREANKNIETTEIIRHIKNAGKPEKGFPKGFETHL